MSGKDLNLSVAGIWKALTAPVIALVEEAALRRSSVERPALDLRVHAGGVEAVRVDGSRQEVLLAVAGRPQQALREIAPRLQPGMGPGVTLSLAADQSISQRLVLPQQPDDVLRAIVRNKVEGLAPWPLALCLWGMRSESIPGDPQHTAVTVAVVSRALLDDLSATIRQAGAEVKALSVGLPDGGQVDIELGSGDVRREARDQAMRRARLAAAAAAVLLGLGLFSIYRTNSAASQMEEDTASLLSSLRPNGAFAGETPLIAAANRLQQERRDRLSAVNVLNELSKLLPDQVHLVSLELDGDQLTIEGQGSGVPGLIQILEASPDFQGVNFAAATELDQNSNSDAFSLIATLEKAPPPEAAP